MNNPKKVLIVDDEILVVKALADKLTAEGFLVDKAYDGQEALLKINQSRPDLILLDIIMPKLDGISVLKMLKALETTKNIPVIILTNLYDDKKMDEVLQTDNTDYLIKVEHSISDIVSRVKKKLKLSI